ncbi:MAG: M67 family metallopeptidase [Clostridiales bacterium]|jgi:proteasome lid subunit RPN8/RPN11|nr:M67 family metallopeptidase [Clostridiales bacterium]
MVIKIKQADYEAIAAHARSALPKEACGLIAGRDEGDTRVIEKVYLLTNADQSREHFSIDPKEQLAAIKDMRKDGLNPLGNFHSHPETPARPSEEDIRLALDAKASYLILSLAENSPVLKAFSIEKGAVISVPLEVG